MGLPEGRPGRASGDRPARHPKAPPDEDPEPVTWTGIDYLALIAGTGQDAAAGDRLHLSNIADGDGTGDDDGTGHEEQEEGQ